jgi:Zn-dependent peptidase ImmA (M78 family)
MTNSDVSQRIAAAIRDLYAEAEVVLPSADGGITPLAELVGNYNLTWIEVDGLTAKQAEVVLLQRGALLGPLDGLGVEPLAGFLYVSAQFGVIFVERRDLLVRRRFTVAHELGHYLLHFRPALARVLEPQGDRPLSIMDALPMAGDEADPEALPRGEVILAGERGAQPSLPAYEEMEREANAFAAELLMPEDIVQARVARLAGEFRGEDLVWRLATDLLVSRATMRWRLRNLGLLAPGAALWN